MAVLNISQVDVKLMRRLGVSNVVKRDTSAIFVKKKTKKKTRNQEKMMSTLKKMKKIKNLMRIPQK